MTPRNLPLYFAVLALSGLAACTDQDKYSNRPSDGAEQPGEPGRADRENLGEISKDTGREVVERRKQIIETERESVPTVEEKRVRADINRMDTEDFAALGLPRNVAENITRYRDEHGKFRSLDDLKRIPGVSGAWLDRNRGKLGLS